MSDFIVNQKKLHRINPIPLHFAKGFISEKEVHSKVLNTIPEKGIKFA